MNTTADRFLGGRLTIRQPADGFRAGHDSVLIAAAVPAKAGDRVLELGSGAGVAALCLAARVQGADITGIELDAELVRLANDNAGANGFSDRVRFIGADVEHSGPGSFDHVFFNPPFHRDTGQVSPSLARDRARRDVSGAVSRWTTMALAHVKDGGTVTAILSAARTDDMLSAAGDHGATILPLFPHEGEAPKRVIVRIVKGAPAGLRTLPGFVLHTRSGGNTDAAEAVLRHAASLVLDG